ncbi:MAG: DUF4416 family protein [Candidatus Omnitrophica bacterium]|nr:DUF4416 family protein [Candidatus Omnitrophota bacterium]
MLYIQFPSCVKLLTGFIYSQEQVYTDTKKILQKKFGEIDFESDCFSFRYTDYYAKEMGTALFRRFVSFKKLIFPDDIVKLKLACIKIEKKFSLKDKRTINIDPGYLNEAKLVLATTKDFCHRIYLGRGVYAEVTLCYRKDNFVDLDTTYPDYRTPEYKAIFLTMRNIYRSQIK